MISYLMGEESLFRGIEKSAYYRCLTEPVLSEDEVFDMTKNEGKKILLHGVYTELNECVGKDSGNRVASYKQSSS
jgi:hypothetical protein